MQNNLYSVYNRLSLRYGDVFASPTDATASREFSTRLNSSPHLIADDYEVCRVGSIDIDSGRVIVEDPVRIHIAFSDGIKDVERGLVNGNSNKA